MTHRPRWHAAVAAAILLTPLTPAGSSAAAEAECTTEQGVTVVVDYGDGTVETGCAPGDPASSEQALADAGFEIARNASGMVCRINGFPEDCPSSPAFDAYWSFWRSVPDEAGDYPGWDYSQVGAGVDDPPAGSLTGWRFGGRGQVPPEHPVSAPAPGESSPGPTDPGPATEAAETQEVVTGGTPWATVLTLGIVVAAGAAFAGWSWWRRRPS